MWKNLTYVKTLLYVNFDNEKKNPCKVPTLKTKIYLKKWITRNNEKCIAM